VLVDQLPGSLPGQVSGGDLELVEMATRKIVLERSAFRADQFNLQSNPRAHYLNTAREIIRQTDGAFHAFCDFAGTGGSFAGCAAAFKEHDPSIRCYLVEPEGAAVLAGQQASNPNHKIQGGGYSMAHLPLLRPEHIDGYLQVSETEAIRTARRLAKQEGIFAGFSSGANVAAALSLLKGACRGSTIVVLLCDSGLKYLSTDLWDSAPIK
jgi:cysteine synthase A